MKRYYGGAITSHRNDAAKIAVHGEVFEASESHSLSLEPGKKPWLVGLYRGLYYPVI